MAQKSKMTTERGLGENVVLTIQKMIKQHQGFTTAVNCWHSKRDNSWNVNVYRSDSGAGKQTLFPVGKGWDFVEAVEKLRENYLVWVSAELELDKVAKNTFEIQQILDDRSGNHRNDVGAVEEDGSEWQKAQTEIKNQIEELKQQFQDILDAVKTLK